MRLARNIRKRTGMLAVVGLAAAVVAVWSASCGGNSELPSAGQATTQTSTTSSTGPTATQSNTSSTSGSAAKLEGTLNGAGATFPQPLYVEWIGEFQAMHPGVTINYQGIGSGGGIEQFTKMTVDFGASDAPMKDEEIARAEEASGAKVMHIPTVMGAVAVIYNLPGVQEVKLDPAALAGIFMGEITSWNDPILASLNPGVSLPDRAIQVVHRSDSSGTTNIFTGYLTQVSPEWAEKVGKGKEVQWPAGIGGKGNDGVAAIVQQQVGAIGYVELSYALESGLSAAVLKNKAGKFVAPSLESTSAAAVGVTFPEDLRFSLSNSEGPDAYPIVGATWILAYDKMNDANKAELLKAWLTWCLTEGTSLAKELHYAPLSDELRELALNKVALIGSF